MKTVFFGTSNFACPILRRLAGEHEIPLVITKADAPSGRGKHLRPSPVKLLAEELRLNVATPKTLKGFDLEKEAGGKKIDLLVTAAYGLILPANILSIPEVAPINVHGSLLPKYRGAAPIQRAIMDGEEKTGVTLMLMDEGMDTGAIISQHEIKIGEKNYAEVESELSELGAKMLGELLAAGENIKEKAAPQNDAEATYAPPIKKEEGELKLGDSPDVSLRKVRALAENPGAYFIWQGQKSKVNDAEVQDGKFKILSLTPPGKKRMSMEDYQRGNPAFREEELAFGR